MKCEKKERIEIRSTYQPPKIKRVQPRVSSTIDVYFYHFAEILSVSRIGIYIFTMNSGSRMRSTEAPMDFQFTSRPSSNAKPVWATSSEDPSTPKKSMSQRT